MSAVLLAAAVVVLLAGAVGVFAARRPRPRLAGLAALASGGVLVLLAADLGLAQVGVVAAMSAATLTALLLVARAIERSATHDDGHELQLDVDPLRWP